MVTDVHRGATVARAESQEMEENYRMLAALEALAGSLAVSKMTNDDVTEIEALYGQVAACQPDDDRLAELNRQFHFRIYECVRARRCFFYSCDYCGGRFLAGPRPVGRTRNRCGSMRSSSGHSNAGTRKR